MNKNKKIIESLIKLEAHCKYHNYIGYDPFDGLSSSIFKKTIFSKYSFFRLFWIQFFKLSPINFRGFFKIKKSYNAKGIALFLHSYCSLLKSKRRGNDIPFSEQYLTEKIHELKDVLLNLKSNKFKESCWGYNFPWQNTVFFQPDNFPTIVATSFCADALFEVYELFGDKTILSECISSSRFIKFHLNRSYDHNGNVIFSYSPNDKSKVYNASLLGCRLLAKAYKFDGDSESKNLAISGLQAIIDKQNSDGSWIYGKSFFQSWIDSFHTGYVLECIYEIKEIMNIKNIDDNFNLGFNFYINNFFRNNGAPKYFHNRTFPIDIHSPAQFFATLSKTNNANYFCEISDKVAEYSINHMQNEKKGYFYYRKYRFFTIKIDYMRWSQAWMFYGLSKKILGNELTFNKKNE